MKRSINYHHFFPTIALNDFNNGEGSAIISYYSSLHINHRIDTSYLFVVMYGLSTFMLSNGFQSMDLGILLTSVFSPLIIFGFIDFIQNDNWLILSLGLILVAFSHVLNSMFIILFLLICLFLNFKLLDKKKIISLFKCLFLTLCTTAIFLCPIFKINVSK